MKETLTTIEKALFLKELDFFRNVGVEQLAEVAAAATERHLEPGEILLRQGDVSEHVYVIVEGNVVLERDGIVVTVLGAGKGFGDLSLEPGSTNALSARAVEHTHVLRFSTQDLVEEMLDHPEIAVGIVRALAQRLRESAATLASLGRQLQDEVGPARAATPDGEPTTRSTP